MLDFPALFASQLAASLAMLHACIEKCPEVHWDTPIAKYPFWQVSYHALCFGDCYSSLGNDLWKPDTSPGGFHPAGREELSQESPSRRFTPQELLRYAAFVQLEAPARVRAETAETLTRPSGFPWLPFNRAELHTYNTRHVQHHVGQLSASLRRVGVEVPWVKASTVSPLPTAQV